MSKPRFKPGKWKIVSDKRWEAINIVDGNGQLLALVKGEANAALIAAVPELYAQLQAVVDYFNEKFVREHHCCEDGVLLSNLVLAEKVLKKARGEA